MNIQQLISGVGIVIDDQINNENANIQEIVKQLEEINMPLVKYAELPTIEVANHFKNISFLILDWKLNSSEIMDEDIEKGVTIPAELRESNAESNIEFLKSVAGKCSNPIFIFTNENTEEIRKLIYREFDLSCEKPNNFFIQSKSNVDKGNLMHEVGSWLIKNPSIYILKKWEQQYEIGKYELFSQFYNMSSNWPNILWQNFINDDVDQSYELNELIFRNLKARVGRYEFDNEILSSQPVSIKKEELLNVLEAERYISKERLSETDVSTGDIFAKEDSNGTIYYLNIRAQCDIVLKREGIDRLKLYLLKGRELDKKDGKYDDYDNNLGIFREKINNCIIPFIAGGKIIVFKFKDLKIEKWRNMKDKRIGMILPPYITRVQQKYAFYQQRQGLPRVPKEAIE